MLNINTSMFFLFFSSLKLIIYSQSDPKFDCYVQ